jgi:hypothetical protein
MELNINPFRNSNPMSWMDAAKLSAILSLAAFFTTFLLPYSYTGITGDMGEFFFGAVRFLGSVFFTNFLSLAGLANLMKKEETKK